MKIRILVFLLYPCVFECVYPSLQFVIIVIVTREIIVLTFNFYPIGYIGYTQ